VSSNIYILGISAYYHDSGASLIRNGEIVSSVQEERFTRVKHDASFPANSLSYILEQENIGLSDISYVAFYDKPFLKFERLLETYLAFAPRGFWTFCQSMTVWIKEKLFLRSVLEKELVKFDSDFDKTKLFFGHHHRSHAASAFFPSPFEDALVVVLDGVGEWSTATVSVGHKNKLTMIKELKFPHSLGLLYSSFTYYCGFKVNSGEYKLMGLAPYGEPIYTDLIKEKLIDLKEDGSFWLDQNYFTYCYGLAMVGKQFEDLFGQPIRRPEDENMSQFYMDIAASIQKVTEEIVEKVVSSAAKEYGQKNLCLAGGVALNCVSNGKIIEKKIFKNVWIQPASGDAGCALGVALDVWHSYLDQPRDPLKTDKMSGSYLGPEYTEKEIRESLIKSGAIFDEKPFKKIVTETAEFLSKGNAVGWFQGKMEFGPRSLGNRSILGDPRDPKTQSRLNLKIKFRESFRPFAPSILSEHVKSWFRLDCDSPYMLLVAPVDEKKRTKNVRSADLKDINHARSSVPAITHVDFSARVQTVHKETNPKFHKLISEFYALTSCPMVVNTSFNVRGEPIVLSPEDAFRCFMGTNLDVLVIGNFILKKTEQDQDLLVNYLNEFELD